MSGTINKNPDVEAFLTWAKNIPSVEINKTGTVKFFDA